MARGHWWRSCHRHSSLESLGRFQCRETELRNEDVIALAAGLPRDLEAGCRDMSVAGRLL